MRFEVKRQIQRLTHMYPFWILSEMQTDLARPKESALHYFAVLFIHVLSRFSFTASSSRAIEFKSEHNC